MNPTRPLTPQKYYRLPWNLADKAITWLEPTSQCDMDCQGCERENHPQGHKPLEQVFTEADASLAQGRADCLCIAGGEPLLYPHIVDLVRFVAAKGVKPIIHSNGAALTPALVRQLTEAGLVGFTLRVDSHQKRPGFTGQTEAELGDLRLKLAQMINDHSQGRVACAFKAAIHRPTLDQVPLLAAWAQANMDLVQAMVFIPPSPAMGQGGFDCFVPGQPADARPLDRQADQAGLAAQAVVDALREKDPDFEPCAYLNAPGDPLSPKWLISLRLGQGQSLLGYLDPGLAEIVQVFHHLFTGTYPAYARPWFNRAAWLLFPLALVNPSLRRALIQWLAKPGAWGQGLYLQTVMIIEPCGPHPGLGQTPATPPAAKSKTKPGPKAKTAAQKP